MRMVNCIAMNVADGVMTNCDVGKEVIDSAGTTLTNIWSQSGERMTGKKRKTSW